MNTPNIRFKGYTDAWEQRKLDSLCDLFTDGDWIESKDQSVDGVRLIQTGNVGITEYVDKENSKKWISEDTFDRLRCEEVFPGDILISRLPEPAGRACIMPDIGTRMITAVDCTIVRTSKNCNNKYLVQYLSTPEYFKKVNSFLGGGTRQRISRGNLSEIQVPMPQDIEEQIKIGEYLTNLDNLIAIHQRKCDDLQEVKKYMLQKLFPQNGAKIPEIRFAGFTGEWVQRKLRDLAEVNPKSVVPEEFEYVDLESVVGTEIISHRTESKESAPSRAQRLAKAGDVFYQTVRPYQKNNCLFEGAEESYVFSTGYAQLRPHGDSYLLLTMLQRDDFVNNVLDRCTGTSYPAINANVLADLTISYPEDVHEQKKIGDHFKNLDNLIALQQRKCDDLQEVKKYMLQNMFPQGK